MGNCFGVDVGEIELGFVINLKTLKEVLRGLSVDGKRWWVESDPSDAALAGFIRIGHGDVNCTDRLNRLHFRVPIIGPVHPKSPTDHLVLLFDPATCTPEEPAFYLRNRQIVADEMEDFLAFYKPLKQAFLKRLQTEL